MAEQCSNPGYDNRFTCPACYHDFENVRATECPSCKAALRCAVEQQPVCVCTLGAVCGNCGQDNPGGGVCMDCHQEVYG